MRYEKGHKDTTRQHIIDVASRQFRGHGVAAVGLAGIMSDAGLTNGAFYTHFDSKEDLVQAVLAKALDRREDRLRAVAADNAGLETMIRDYLSPRHRDRRRRWLPDRRAGRGGRPPPQSHARCLHRESIDLHRADRDAD